MGVDYARSQFNRATDSLRQPGSSFKIFVYSTAMEQLGYKPTTTVSDRPVCIGDWCPQNFERSFMGAVPLQTAFAESLNTVAVNLSIKTGRQPIADMAHRMGITADFPGDPGAGAGCRPGQRHRYGFGLCGRRQ